MNAMDYDVTIVGGGVTGCAIARELSRYRLNICLVEREEDVCSGTSKANSAIVHAGFDAKPGSLKARMNLEGSRRMEALSRELDFAYRRNGALVLCFSEADRPALEALYARGRANGVEGLRIISGDEARNMEPNLSDRVVSALYAPGSAIICPFELTIALAENACENGVCFRLNERVESIEAVGNGYALTTTKGKILSRFVVNATGVYADVINNMVSARKLRITPRRGDYYLLDRQAGSHVSSTIFQLPGQFGKGVLVTPTVHGNLLIGPTATDAEDREGTQTSRDDLECIRSKSAMSVKNIPYNQVITSFAGLRAHEAGGDFVLGEAEDAPGFFNAAGIESPGLSSAPAIGAYIAEEIAVRAQAVPRGDFQPRRIGIVRAAALPMDVRAELIRKNPLYGKIVCRCEQVSEGEIMDAIHRPVGARSLDGVKRRVRAGMGRCQAGFCTPRTMEILARECNLPLTAICKNSPGSEMLVGMMGEDEA